MFKKKKTLLKMVDYAENWDTTEYGYVRVCRNGNLCPTNNKDSDGLYLDKMEFFEVIKYIQTCC